MKNPIIQFSLVLIAFIAFTFLMSYTKPSAEEPKQYIVVYKPAGFGINPDKFQEEVNQKLSEGWHLQGGLTVFGVGGYNQAMVK